MLNEPKRQVWKPGTMIYPLPAIIVSCGTFEQSNLITIAWTGTICTDPALLYISVRPERHSYSIIKQQMEFTVNLTTTDMAHAVDWCGVRSGKDYDKWKETGLTKGKGIKVQCPFIAESPLNIECRVKEIVHFGSHDMFIAEVLDVLANPDLIDDKGVFNLGEANLLNYTHGHYYSQGNPLGNFGWTVRKK